MYSRFHSEESDSRLTSPGTPHDWTVVVPCLRLGGFGTRARVPRHALRAFFTVSTEARFEFLMRLLELNFTQAAEQTGMSRETVLREAQQYV